MASTTSSVTRAITAGKLAGVKVQAWGSDMVRINNSSIMSAADAVNWGIDRAAR